MVRASQGIATSQPVGVDTAFVGHVEGALASGLAVGVYHAFLGAREGAPQADFLLETIAPYRARLKLWIAVDVEVSNGQPPDVVADRLFAMLKRLEERLGYKVMIYTAPGVWNEIVGDAHDAYFTQHPLWVAHWIE